MNDDTWLVVPLYNEEQVIGDVVTGARERFSKIVCVDDGSRDHSAVRAREAGAVVVRHPINLGQGAALQTGLSYALTDPTMQYVVTFDADGQHQVSDAEAMVERLRTEPLDVVFGSRFLEQKTRPPLLKRALLRAAIAYSNASTSVRLTDTHNGLRALNRTAVATLDIKQNRMAHASEIIDQIGKAKLRYAEHPVHILYTDYSRAKGQSLLNSVNILAELIYR
jgi:glycosyltransferase involved in cell wall biosynthesis